LVLPAALRGARVNGPRAAIAGMVALVLLAAALFGVRVAWARAASAPEAVPQPGSTAQPASAVASRSAGSEGFAGSGDRTPGGPTTPANGAGAGELVVHVVGQVKRPGVVVLAVGARVRDAVAKAGGARSGADLGALNLARPLVDGEQLRVPRPGESPAPADAGASGSGAGGSGGGSPGSAGGPGGAVNLNTANQAVLEELPGVGPVLAQRIIDWRSEHGRFTSVDELAEVSGIGEKMFAALQDKVTV
jgi:competence protein ComEA